MKFLKIFLITIIFINSAVSLAFANDTTPETPAPETQTSEKPSQSKPTLKMGGNNTYSIEAGKSTEVTIPIVNTSADTAFDVLIQAKATGESSPLTVKFLNSSDRTTKILRGGSHTATLSIEVDKNATTGKYPVTLEYSFTSLDKGSFTSSDTFYVKIDNGSVVPTVALNNLKVSKDSVILGDTFDITASLENVSGMEANNVNVELIGLEESNITAAGGKSNEFFSKMSANTTQPISFKLATTNITKEGSNKITLKVTYNDFSGKEYTKDYFGYVTVSKTGSTSGNIDLKISSLIAPTGTFNVGQSGTFKLKVKNASSVDVKGVKVTAKLPENIVPTSSNIVLIDSLTPNQEKEVSFSVAPTASAVTQTYSIGFSVEYSNGNKSTNAEGTQTTDSTVIEQYAGFNVNNPTPKKDGENAKTSVPKIIVSRYESTPNIVEAGKSFQLSMNFRNTHESKTVKNIKIYLTVEDKTEEKGNVFAPDNSSTTYFIDSISPKQEVAHTFNLFAVPDAKPRSYTVNVNLEYEDEQANEYKLVELVGVNVKQQANLELSEITKPDIGNVGNPMNINFQLYNTGKVTLSNLMIKLDGEGFDTSTSTNFIGNFEPGATEYYDGMFTPTQTGEKNLKLIITYNDTDGKQVEKVEEFKINVEEMVMPEDNGMPESMPEPEKKFPVKTIGIICAIVFVIGVGIFIFVKKAKAKKELDFND
ncbi:MAG: COG1361 S-layer family protein [Lachnospirales bacterium]